MAWLEVCLHIKAPAEAIQAWKLNMSYFSLYFYPNSSSYRGSYFKYGIGVRVRKFCGFILGGLSGVGCWVSSDVCNYGWDLHVVGGVLWGGYFGDMCFIHTPAAEFCKLMGIFPFTLGLGWRTSQLQEAQGEGLAVGHKTFWGRLVGSHPDSDVFCQKDRKKEATVVNLAAWRCRLRWVDSDLRSLGWWAHQLGTRGPISRGGEGTTPSGWCCQCLACGQRGRFFFVGGD